MARLDEIQAFVVIARTRSIGQAAEQLGIAKSAASRRLSNLEARLGVQLVFRTTRKFSLTEEGQSFLANAESALEALDSAEHSVRNEGQELSGTLNVAAPLSYGLSKMQPVFTQFLLDNPDVALRADFSDRAVDLVQDGSDVAIRIGDLQDSSLVARKITSVRHCAVASPEFWRSHGTPTVPEDLRKLPFLRYENLSTRQLLTFERPDKSKGTISPPQRVRASNGDFLAQMAVAGLGFMVEPEFVVEPYLKTGDLIKVLSDHTWLETNLYAVFPPGRRQTRRTRVFVDFLEDALR